jgi:hypothetical protein
LDYICGSCKHCNGYDIAMCCNARSPHYHSEVEAGDGCGEWEADTPTR